MQYSIVITVIGLCVVYHVRGFYPNPDCTVDLTTGSATASRFITLESPLTGTGTCAKRGVLKINFLPPNARDRHEKVLIDMMFYNPTGMVFNLGDSSTNNGYGGDSHTTSRDAEAQGVGSTLSIYGNDHMETDRKLLFTRPNVIDHRLTVIISNGLIIWNNWGAEFNYLLNYEHLYALKGQKDEQAYRPNYAIYLGMNRVIRTRRGRRGTGLCNVYVKWLS